MRRLDAVFARARAQGLAALLVSTPSNTHYLSGFQAVTVTDEGADVLTPHPRELDALIIRVQTP